MARLFSALVPPEPARAELAGYLAPFLASPEVSGLRWAPVERWHVTLGFFGDDDDPVRRGRWLARRAGGLPAPRLRLAGAGTFPGVLWVGVHAETEADERALARLAQAAGAGRRGFRAHLTVARWRPGQANRPELNGLFVGYTGPWFTPGELLLMRSDLHPGGPTYTTVDRLPLARTEPS